VSWGILRSLERFGYKALRSGNGATHGCSTTAHKENHQKYPVFSLKFIPIHPIGEQEARFSSRSMLAILGGVSMTPFTIVAGIAIATVLGGCAPGEIVLPRHKTYSITHDTAGCGDFPVTSREVGDGYHESHVEWVYQPHVIAPDPPVVIHENP